MDKKIDENTIEIAEVVPQQTVTRTYDIRNLLRQRDMIQSQKDADNAARDAELSDVNDILRRAELAGVDVSGVEDKTK